MCVKGANVCCCVQPTAGQVGVLKVSVCVVVFILQVCVCVKGASVCCCVRLSAGQVCVLKVPMCVVVFGLVRDRCVC